MWHSTILLLAAGGATAIPRNLWSEHIIPNVSIITNKPVPITNSNAIYNIAFGNSSNVAPNINAVQPEGDLQKIASKLAVDAPNVKLTLPSWGSGGGSGSTGNFVQPQGEYLYVWAGAEGRQQSDYLLTLDFNRNSDTYGRPISATPVDTSGNEPHHCGLSRDKSRLLCGGFFSVLKSQNDIFIFDVTKPAYPNYLGSSAGEHGSVPDDFIPLSDNTFILSYMGSKQGGTPGRIAKLDRHGNFLGEYPTDDQVMPSGWNPHGVGVREDLNLFVSTDFIAPDTALNTYKGDVALRNTIGVWDLAAMRLKYRFVLPTGTGTMDAKIMHLHPDGIGFVGGTGNGQLWVFNTATRKAKRVIDLNSEIVPPWLREYYSIDSQMMQISPDDTRLYVPYSSKNDQFTGKSGYYSGVAVIDITDPWNPRMIQNSAMPAYAGPHLGQLYGDRFVTAGYFLDMDDFGKLHLNGDHVVRTLNVQPDGTLQEDRRFQVDFDNIIPQVALRPHGLQTINTNV